MYYIIITPKAKKELKAISKIYRKALAQVIEELAEDPFIGKPLTRNLTGKYSQRVGVYRISYKISKKDKKITIITAGHRATIYQ